VSVLVLWDIDNTLLYTGGAGSLAMARAFHDLYGVQDAFVRVEFSGRTDTSIFQDAAVAAGLDVSNLPGELARFIDAYVPHLRRTLPEVPGGSLMPGVSAALEALSARKDVIMGLGTGNFRLGAELKLRHYAIERYFPGFPGGFGEDSPLRDDVIGKGIERLAALDGYVSRVVVVGDTPHDVTAAKANGAYALGVGTGRNAADELRSYGADHALDDLADTERVVKLILGA
jgi:phosphoglycolate phosphatase